ncbi:MAG: ferrochelatase [Actinomycetaceae bacterium]|nr:ferrochelatase [Actinomycetaceae bacterium]
MTAPHSQPDAGVNADPLAPYDAVLLCNYGGPDGPGAVLPFMRNATNGRGIPDERLMEVATHYENYGGVSPIIARTNELMGALQNQLRTLGSQVPIYLGNRNWHPFFADTLRALVHAGHRRILMLPTAAYASYSGCRQYREDVWAARQKLIDEGVVGAEELTVERAPLYYDDPGFIAANAQAVERAIDELKQQGHKKPHLLFVTHSIPMGMQAATENVGRDYASQHLEHIEALLNQLGGAQDLEWELSYCSRSGPPQAKWLEPDVNDSIERLASEGVKSVVVAPIGFIQDHMEVVHDLDTEAAETAAECGIGFARAATAGVDEKFISGLAALLVGRAARARAGADPDLTGHAWHDEPTKCCLPRPGATPQPAISQADLGQPQSPKSTESTVSHSASKENAMTTESAHPHAHGGHPGHPGHGGGHPGHGGGHPGHPGHGAHPTGHEDGPADPRDHEVDYQEVNAKEHFFLHAVFTDTRDLQTQREQREGASDLAKEIEEAIAATGTQVRGFYNVEGFKAGADFMVWFYADSADKVQAAYRALRTSKLGQYLKPVWNAMSAHIPAEFDASHLPACLAGAAPRRWLAVYPFVRTLDWYYLNPNRRRAMLREHGMNGRDYLDVKVSTLAAFALGDYEWTLSLEADTLDRVMGVLRKQRAVEARVYTRIDTPFYTGERMELEDWLRR